MASAASLLAQIDLAIEALLTGGASSYSIGSRSVTKLDLSQLLNERRMLQRQVERESSASGAFRLGRIVRGGS
jgi:hypothetical protein